MLKQHGINLDIFNKPFTSLRLLMHVTMGIFNINSAQMSFKLPTIVINAMSAIECQYSLKHSSV